MMLKNKLETPQNIFNFYIPIIPIFQKMIGLR